MKSIAFVFRLLFLSVFLAGMLAAPAQPAFASPPQSSGDESKGVSPEKFLNPDGTLNLNGDFSGTFDLEGWDVQLDPAKGPLFSPIAAQNDWAAVGSGGGAFKDGIMSILVDGSDVYVGGWFQDAGGNLEADHIAKWDGSQWVPLSNGGSGASAITGGVRAMVMHGGNLYVGGGFAARNTSGAAISNANNLAVWNGTAWSAVPGMTANLNSTVQALSVDSTNNILYFGGGFTNANGNTEADRIAGIDLDTSTLVTLGNNGASDGALSSEVYAVAVSSTGVVYAGGFFTNVNNGGTINQEADYVAKWDGTNWSNLGNNGSGTGALNSIVTAIAVDASDNVYIGGWYSNAAGIPEADYIAKWDGASWSALGNNGPGNGALLSSGGGSTIQEIVINGTDVYVGGYFIGSSGIPTADYAARFDTNTNTWSGLGNNGSGNGSLNDGVIGMAYSGGTLYVGGSMYDVSNGGTAIPTADYFAAWDGTNWSTLGDSNGVLNFEVDALAVIGTDVYAGGNFVNLGGNPSIDHLARWDGSQWNPVGNLTQPFGSLNGRVRALAVDGTNLYAGGDFTNAYNEGVSVLVNRIAKWDGSNWFALGNGVNASVYALAVDSSHNLYAGGGFFDVESIPEADFIAKWNGSNWSALSGNGSGNGALNSYVSAIAINGANVYVGGNFSSVVDTSNTAIPNAAYLAKWNGSAWSAIDGVTSPLSNPVFALTLSGSDLYVGGVFTNLNGMDAADYIAKWNGSVWSALGSNNLGGGSIIGSVRAIYVDGTKVYAGGDFSNVNNGAAVLSDADYIAMWDGTNWNALGSNGSGNGSLNRYVNALLLLDSDLWVGGDFQNVNNNGAVIKEADLLAVYGVDSAVPTVSSIVRADSSPTATVSVNFIVTFSESVTGVDTGDFSLATTGVSGATISEVSGSGNTYYVTVNTGSGDGTIRLDVTDDDSIKDVSLNPLGGTGTGNGDFTGGETYTIDKTLTLVSQGSQDGWILESSEASGTGGTMNSSAATFNLGDDAANRQYRTILHFDTSA
ncbi:MAG: hypothetical protein DPW18_20465, partial [Chloroflexi bacterium]|nr:hypothetical protein [Chloroflexota bacterium]MDL1945118.1 hypothetical protein [Chloroflexi bacterium CFX2]